VAQITGGSDFDGVWNERANVSLALLREAADAIAQRGSSALRPVLVVESLLSVLFNPLPPKSVWGRPQWPVRFFDDMAQTQPSARESRDKMGASQPRPDCNEDGAVEMLSEHIGGGEPEKFIASLSHY